MRATRSSERSNETKVGEHRDGLGRRSVGVGPARKLVQVVADARSGGSVRAQWRVPARSTSAFAPSPAATSRTATRPPLPPSPARRRALRASRARRSSRCGAQARAHRRRGSGRGLPRPLADPRSARKTGGSQGGGATPSPAAAFNTASAGLRTLRVPDSPRTSVPDTSRRRESRVGGISIPYTEEPDPDRVNRPNRGGFPRGPAPSRSCIGLHQPCPRRLGQRLPGTFPTPRRRGSPRSARRSTRPPRTRSSPPPPAPDPGP